MKNRDQRRLETIRSDFVDWTKNTDFGDGKIHTYTQLNRDIAPDSVSQIQDKRTFIVSNTAAVHWPTGLFHDPKTISPDPDRFYLLPAKKWVSSPEEVLEEWELWRARTF
ncbi:signal peptide protein [Rhodopirellula europaea 6C]|uniref:Signal peptide protein n=1 Tax=Rhodopirellula europaea 6C TaxID=1263867 RepID=M2B6S6_9BACT|nr:signal peptide protein [Rhodopirellula europaea 6C]